VHGRIVNFYFVPFHSHECKGRFSKGAQADGEISKRFTHARLFIIIVAPEALFRLIRNLSNANLRQYIHVIIMKRARLITGVNEPVNFVRAVNLNNRAALISLPKAKPISCFEAQKQ
jgi:hypothetical protein